ncbi:MAG: DUF2304 domain-containing protein [Oscillospiraceae bacterium]|nr:DUF2304 domain-containing protein [Oscillospiraceae bacterium]
MMDFVKNTLTLQHLLIIGSFVLFAMIVWLIKNKKIEVKYSIIWLAFSATMIAFALCRYLVLVLSDITGVVNPVNFIFLTQIIFILLILLSVTAVISGFSRKIKRLAQSNALLEKRVRELERKITEKE